MRPNQNSSAASVMNTLSGATSESDSTRSNKYRAQALYHSLSFRRATIKTSIVLIAYLYHSLVSGTARGPNFHISAKR
jgi:hypothetical protein